jgi:hypothetical protein
MSASTQSLPLLAPSSWRRETAQWRRRRRGRRGGGVKDEDEDEVVVVVEQDSVREGQRQVGGGSDC